MLNTAFKTIIGALALGALTITTVAPVSAAILVRVPTKQKVSAASNDYCGDAMGYLRIVRKTELAHEFAKISVQPICEGDDAGSIRSTGNAGGLRTTIGADEAMAAALAKKDYAANDVVGVVFGGGNTLILYVHKD